ncbi:hypothetical protein MVES1_003461 [Malassezia vespertilionis]|uniref:Nup133p n=1 Tax=Malassezia vespertilionis TaxID=2020962 RepID=A0A2N1J7C8_9BASI|nr:uncharacterized protein MVES1_003461 [Malassezia vespertilionis]PKI82454.1 Nup133p [Malassezia vespertilionis]WFD08092.1 hypothetical protein MVES1_003461 [Malassezia vespertilionis]
MASRVHRGVREPALLLQDSVFRVRLATQALLPNAASALRTDPYVTPSTAGMDPESEYVFCATPQRCYVWRSTSPNPTMYEFPVAPSDPPAAPFCIVLPRPLHASAEPALLLASGDGHVRFWDAVSDAFTTQEQDIVALKLPLAPDERISAAARVDPSQAVLATTHARIFQLHVFVHRGEHELSYALYAEHRSRFLGRFLGGTSGDASAGPIQRLAVHQNAGEMHAMVVAQNDHALQCWRAPIAGTGGSAHQHAKLVFADRNVHKTIASRAMYLRGERYSAAASAFISMVDCAFRANGQLVVLYSETRNEGATYGLALLAPPTEHTHTLVVEHILPLRHAHAADPRPGTAPSLRISEHQEAALIAFEHALLTKLLETDSAEETLHLKPRAARVRASCVLAPLDTHVRFAALLDAGVLLIEMDVAHCQQLAKAQHPSSTTMASSRVARMQERLEKAVWFGEDAENILQLDILPDTLDAGVLQAAVECLSTAIVDSQLQAMPDTVDLRAQLTQRAACALRLVQLVGQNGFLTQLSRTTRLQLRSDAELLAGACDLWRFYDEAVKSAGLEARVPCTVLPNAIRAVLHETPKDAERHFFQHHLARMPALFAAWRQGVSEPMPRVLDTTRLLLALLVGAARYRAEHGEAYALEADPVVAYEPWYADGVLIALLETLFQASLHALQHPTAHGSDAELRTQLCALAELAMNAYTARIAFLTAAAHASDQEAAAALSATHAAYDHARPALLFPLLDIGRADRAFALAETHRDFASLVALCFAEERSDTGKRAKTAHLSAPPALRVESYLDRYGTPFADELYTYYIQHGAYRTLFEPQEAHAALLQHFLARHAQYTRIAWIHEISLGQYREASNVLRACAHAERDNLHAEQVMLSVSKLAHLAALSDLDQALASPSEQAALEAWDDALDLVHVQERLKRKWYGAAMPRGAAPEAAAQRIAQLVAPQLAPALHALFVMLAAQVAGDQVASGEDMMDLLTLQDTPYAAPPDAPLSDFAIAAQVYVRIDAHSQRPAALAALWRRLYLQDDWHALSDTANKADDEVLVSVRSTVAFSTIQAVLANESTAPLLLAPHDVCSHAPSSITALSQRFSGLPDAQIEQLHAALAAEHAALVEVVHATKLDAFFAQVLAQPPVQAPSPRITDTLPSTFPEMAHIDSM